MARRALVVQTAAMDPRAPKSHSIKHWPAGERPRERLLAQGPAALSDAELLAILLRTGVRGTSAVDLARRLLAEHGGVRGLLTLPLGQLQKARGLGPARTAQLGAALELARRHYAQTMTRGPGLESPVQAAQYLRACLRDRPNEVFGCLFLDQRHRPIAFEEAFHGTIDHSAVHPRELVRRALAHNAAAVILAHNHPSGVAEPSAADVELTRKVGAALRLIDVRVLDHLIVGDLGVTSLAERGLL
jgi:DNA repair protein RadC